jgi:hypothetical protein
LTTLRLPRLAVGHVKWRFPSRSFTPGRWSQPCAPPGRLRRLSCTGRHASAQSAVPCGLQHQPTHVDDHVFLLRAGRCVPACHPTAPDSKRIRCPVRGLGASRRPHTPLHTLPSFPAARYTPLSESRSRKPHAKSNLASHHSPHDPPQLCLLPFFFHCRCRRHGQHLPRASALPFRHHAIISCLRLPG